MLNDGATRRGLDDVYIKFAALDICGNECGRQAARCHLHPAALFPDKLADEAVLVEQRLEPGQVVQQYQNVEVFVQSGLAPEQGIQAPATHHPEADGALLQELAKGYGVVGG